MWCVVLQMVLSRDEFLGVLIIEWLLAGAVGDLFTRFGGGALSLFLGRGDFGGVGGILFGDLSFLGVVGESKFICCGCTRFGIDRGKGEEREEILKFSKEGVLLVLLVFSLKNVLKVW
jgi:hypothetical protein